MAKSLTKDQFIERANNVHNSKYKYDKSFYRNMRKPIKIICPEHGEFEQSPMNHLKTAGCPKCGYSNRTKPTQPIDNQPNEDIIGKMRDEAVDTQVASCMNILTKLSKPLTKVIIDKNEFSDIILSDTMMNSIQDDHLVYEHIDSEQLQKLVNSDKFHESNTHIVATITTKMLINWEKLVNNATFKYEWLSTFKEKLTVNQIIKSPCFINRNNKTPLSTSDNLLTFDDLLILCKENIDIETGLSDLTSINLDDTFFTADNISLYESYIRPRLFNGLTVTKKQELLFNDRLIEEGYLTLVAGNSKNNALLKASDDLFSSVLYKCSPDLYRVIVAEYMPKRLFRDLVLMRYIGYSFDIFPVDIIAQQNVLNMISKYQVPSIKFIHEYRHMINGIDIIKTMIRNNRVFDVYVNEFIDEIIEYDRIRSTIHKKSMLFTSNSLMHEANHLSYRTVVTDSDISEYRDDIMNILYGMCSKNKMYRMIYESIRGKEVTENSDLISNIQSEVEELLKKSDELSKKLKEFKKSSL